MTNAITIENLQPGWHIFPSVRGGTGAITRQGPFDTDKDAEWAAHDADCYHRQFGIDAGPTRLVRVTDRGWYRLAIGDRGQYVPDGPFASRDAALGAAQ